LAKGENAHNVMRQLFVENKVTGLLAFDGDKAVGWCSYGPRSDYPRIERTKAYRRDDTENVWCINCFFIDKHYRNKGVATEMLDAAVKFVRKRKIKTVEAYPVPLTKDGKKKDCRGLPGPADQRRQKTTGGVCLYRPAEDVRGYRFRDHSAFILLPPAGAEDPAVIRKCNTIAAYVAAGL